jgi:LPXTG-motif cell wall-anchored protein
MDDMNGQTQRQGGWVATFVIVGALLVLGLVGSVYFVKARHDAANQPTDQSHSSNSPAKSDKPASDKPASDQKPTVKTPDTTDSEPGSQTGSNTAQPPTASDGDVQHPLPQTGPEETLGSLVVLGLVAFLTVSYVRSRRLAAGRHL